MLNRILSSLSRGTAPTTSSRRMPRRTAAQPTTGGTVGSLLRGLSRRRGL